MYYNNMEECITEQIFNLVAGDEMKELSEYENENIYHFGYVYYDGFNIIKLDESRGDKVLRLKDGSNEFLIKYKDDYYQGYWNEGEYDLDYAAFQPDDLNCELSGCTRGSPENIELFLNEMLNREITEFRVIQF